MADLARVKARRRRLQRKGDGVDSPTVTLMERVRAAGNGKNPAVDLEALDLNQRQWMFAIYYVHYLNAGKAAVAAGYSKKTAASKGSQLLKHDGVKTVIEHIGQMTLDNTSVNVDRLVSELTDIALADTDLRGSDKIAAIRMLFDYEYKILNPNSGPIQLVVTYEGDASQDAALIEVGDIEEAEWEEVEPDED